MCDIVFVFYRISVMFNVSKKCILKNNVRYCLIFNDSSFVTWVGVENNLLILLLILLEALLQFVCAFETLKSPFIMN